MGYSGFTEYICGNGHYTAVDSWEDRQPKTCTCGSEMAHYHHVHTTNGMYEDDPSTFHAEKVEIGFDDLWFEDHYGNKYATKRLRFRTEGTEWRYL